MEDSARERTILVIESNAEHLQIVEAVLTKNATHSQIVTLSNGMQAIQYLRHQGDFATATRPDLILLDLNLPDKDGRDILAEIKADPQLKRIPIVVLTTAASEEDVFKAYALQGNCFVIKSFDSEQLAKIVQRIEEFWLEIVTLPGE